MNRYSVIASHPRQLQPLATLAALIVAAAGFAADLQVPGKYPTIQAAVDAAADGDVVRIAPGVYTEQIKIVGKKLTLQGWPGTILRAYPDMEVLLKDTYGETYDLRQLLAAVLADVTVRGIDFEGEHLFGNSQLVTGVEFVSTRATVEDCRFTGFRGPKLWSYDGWAVSVNNLSKLGHVALDTPSTVDFIVRRSEFTDNFSSIHLYGDDVLAPSELRTRFLIEDSTFIGCGPSNDPGPQWGIYIHCGAGGEIRRNRIEEYSFVGTPPDPLNKWAFGVIAFDSAWLVGARPGQEHSSPLQRVSLHDNVFRNNQVHINISDGAGVDVTNNRFEGSSTGHRPFAVVTSGGPNTIQSNTFEDQHTAVFLLGNDSEIGNAFGPAHDTVLADNRFCNTSRQLEANPNVTNTRVTHSVTCPYPVPPPTISQAVLVAWIFDGTGYLVESAPSPSGPWSDIGLIPTVSEGRSSVTVPASTEIQFFRLRRP